MCGSQKQRYQTHNNTFFRCGALVVLLCVLFTAETRAEEPEHTADLETPRGIAMGAGGRASAQAASALAYNPANLSLGGIYHINVFTGYVPGSERWTVGGSIVDSMTNQNIAMGVSFRGVLGNGEEGYSGFDGRLAIAIPFSEQISFGVGGRYLSFEQEGQSATTGLRDGRHACEGFYHGCGASLYPE